MKTRTQSRMTWITLVACILVALMPVGGLVLCLGHDGHFGVGAASTTGVDDAEPPACPCDHAAAANPDEDGDDDHPPCRDLEFDESPLVFSQAGDAGLDLGDSDSKERSPLPPLLTAVFAGSDSFVSAGALAIRPPRARTSSTLFERRTIVLLI